jgi:restriction endonuclease S subunit
MVQKLRNTRLHNLVPSANWVYTSLERRGLWVSPDIIKQMNGWRLINIDQNSALVMQIPSSQKDLNELFNFYLQAVPIMTISAFRRWIHSTSSDHHIPNQKEIVEKLDSAFAEIDLLEENLRLNDEKTNQLLQSLLSAAFTFSGDTVDQGNPSANQGFAMNFSVKPLGELCKLTMGRTPPRGNSKYWDSSRKTKNIWISIADMTKSLDGTLIDSKEYLSDEGSKTFPKVKMGTLLLSFKLSIGKLAIAGTELQTNEAIMAMNELNKDLILQNYLYYFLFGFDWSEALEGRFKVKGNTLNKKILEELPIKFPSLEKQHEIVEKLDSAFAEIELLKAQIKIEQDYATALRQSLLSNAFTREDAAA